MLVDVNVHTCKGKNTRGLLTKACSSALPLTLPKGITESCNKRKKLHATFAHGEISAEHYGRNRGPTVKKFYMQSFMRSMVLL